MTATAIEARLTRANPLLRKAASPYAGLSLDEVFTQAGLDFQVEKVPLFTQWGDPAPAFATRRTDTEAILGVVGKRYDVRQNDEIKDILGPYVGRDGFTITRAGSFGGGAKVYLEAEIGGPAEVAVGDAVACRARFDASHDGSRKYGFEMQPLRLVCLNGAVTSRGGVAFSFPHTRSGPEKMRLLEAFVARIRAQFKTVLEEYRALARQPITAAKFNQYVKDVFFPAESEEQKAESRSMRQQKREERLLNQILDNFSRDRDAFAAMMERYEEPIQVNPGANVLDDIVRNFESGAGSDIPSSRSTYWNAYNAVTEYVNHQRGRDPERRLEASWYGAGHDLSVRALDLALAAVN
jgi:phage/plasmid-like protein (TIGR03299 family)